MVGNGATRGETGKAPLAGLAAGAAAAALSARLAPARFSALAKGSSARSILWPMASPTLSPARAEAFGAFVFGAFGVSGGLLAISWPPQAWRPAP